jgi:3'-5' exoribonuclease
MDSIKTQFVKDLKPGLPVNSIFLINKKTVKKKKNGEDYCQICMQDKTGSIDGIIWTDVFNGTGTFKEGDFAFIKGDVSDYKGARQLTVNSIVKIGTENAENLNHSDYVRTSGKNPDEMFEQLSSYIGNIKNPYLKKLMGTFFDDEDFSKKFRTSTAAVQYHHAYVGGLLEHTLSMVKLCGAILDNYIDLKIVNDDFRDLTITGAILHDIGKLREYGTEKNGALIKITDEGKLLGHISMGYGMVLEKIMMIKDFPVNLKDRLLHIILSHHGHKEFGSPKLPKTLEAFIVYHVDHLDADIAGFGTVLQNSTKETDWSDYLRNFERSVFLKDMSFDDISEENSSILNSINIPEEEPPTGTKLF